MITDRSVEFRKCVAIFGKMAPGSGYQKKSAPASISPLSKEALSISTFLARTSELMDKLERDLTSSGGAFDSKESRVVEEISLIGRRLEGVKTRLDVLTVQSTNQSLNSTTGKHWKELLGHSLEPRFLALAKRFKQANSMRIASLQSMHTRHEKYFTKDLVHLTAAATNIRGSRGSYGPSQQKKRQQQPIQNVQLPYQKLQASSQGTSTVVPPLPSSSYSSSSSSSSSYSSSSYSSSSNGYKQYYQSPYQRTSATNSNNNNNNGPTNVTINTSRSNAPGSYIPNQSAYGNGSGPQLRNRRDPGASTFGHVVNNPYVKTASSDNPYSNPYSRSNPYSNQNNRMMTSNNHQQQSYSTSNASRTRERVENAKMVAKQFAQVGEMTATLAEIVEQQDEWIADLETETEEASDHVDRGQTELLKLWQNVSGDRGLMLKLFAVLISFIILFFWLNRIKG
jgi:hypothetical protein